MWLELAVVQVGRAYRNKLLSRCALAVLLGGMGTLAMGTPGEAGQSGLWTRAFQPAVTMPLHAGGVLDTAGRNLTQGGSEALHRGAYEVKLTASPGFGNPYFEVDLRVTFTRPDGSEVTVDGFYDGDNTFKARAYCDTVGVWKWRSASDNSGLANHSGSFRVVPSNLKGKLKRHPLDPRQFAYENGEWFLHIGDTGYRYPVDSEPKWKEYIAQADKMSATKIRTWFAKARSDVQVLFVDDRKALNLPYWQEIDRRLAYALDKPPRRDSGTDPLRRGLGGGAALRKGRQGIAARRQVRSGALLLISEYLLVYF